MHSTLQLPDRKTKKKPGVYINLVLFNMPTQTARGPQASGALPSLLRRVP